MQHLLKTAALALAIGSTFAAYAQSAKGGGGDGVITIDAAKAATGGITSGDTPGYPITISQPGSYRLAGNLTLADATVHAIEITARNVTLDLAGFAIVGPHTCTGYPAQCSGGGNGVGVRIALTDSPPTGVTVRNGTIRGMGVGIVTQHNNVGTQLERLHLVGNMTSGANVYFTVLRDSQVTSNGNFGVLGDSNALYDNVVRYNGQYGVRSGEGVQLANLLARNVLQGNGTNLSNAIQLAPNLCGLAPCP